MLKYYLLTALFFSHSPFDPLYGASETGLQNITIPTHLYKIISSAQWNKSQKQDFIALNSDDKDFIHFSTEDQLDRIITKYWNNETGFVVLKVDSTQLTGSMHFETNPGAETKYYHLYQGSIPLSSVVEFKIYKDTKVIDPILSNPLIEEKKS